MTVMGSLWRRPWAAAIPRPGPDPGLGRAEARPEHEHRPQLASLHSVTAKTSQSGRGEQMHKILPAWPKRPHTEQALDFPVARCRALTSMGNSENVSNFD